MVDQEFRRITTVEVTVPNSVTLADGKEFMNIKSNVYWPSSIRLSDDETIEKVKFTTDSLWYGNSSVVTWKIKDTEQYLGVMISNSASKAYRDWLGVGIFGPDDINDDIFSKMYDCNENAQPSFTKGVCDPENHSQNDIKFEDDKFIVQGNMTGSSNKWTASVKVIVK